jgi:hypothetical protein
MGLAGGSMMACNILALSATMLETTGGQQLGRRHPAQMFQPQSDAVVAVLAVKAAAAERRARHRPRRQVLSELAPDGPFGWPGRRW